MTGQQDFWYPGHQRFFNACCSVISNVVLKIDLLTEYMIYMADNAEMRKGKRRKEGINSMVHQLQKTLIYHLQIWFSGCSGDKHSNCRGWAAKGYCKDKRYEQYMRENCCKTCKAKPVTAAPTTVPPTTVPGKNDPSRFHTSFKGYMGCSFNILSLTSPSNGTSFLIS